MPAGSGLLPCPVERVRSAGQKAPVIGSSSTGGNHEETGSAEPGGHSAADETPQGDEDMLAQKQ